MILLLLLGVVLHLTAKHLMDAGSHSVTPLLLDRQPSPTSPAMLLPEAISKAHNYLQSMYDLLRQKSEGTKFLEVIEDFLLNGYDDIALRSQISASDYLFSVKNYINLVVGNVLDPYVFPAGLHRAIREPFDYYNWSLSLLNPLVDWGKSHIEGTENLEAIYQLLKKGENVFLVSNHQTEADPMALGLFLGKGKYAQIIQDTIFVAGHKVRSDPTAIPGTQWG